MTLRARQVLIVVVVFAAISAGAAGQVRPGQSGRALDSSFQVGSGGINTPAVPRRTFGGQLYVTGQVTGLAGFRGQTGYYAPDQLRMDLPSADLSGFRGRSISLPDVMDRTTYGSLPYYERTQTAFGLREIAAGLTAPGSSMPRSGTLAPAATGALYKQAVAGYEPIVTAQPGRLLSVPSLPSPALPPLPGSAQQALSRPGATALFGVRDARQRQQLARQLFDLAVAEDEDQAEGEPQAYGTTAGADRQFGPRRSPGRGPVEQTPPVTGTSDLLKPGESRVGEQQQFPQPNQDVYLDLLVQLRQRQRAGRRTAGRAPSGARRRRVTELAAKAESLQSPGLVTRDEQGSAGPRGGLVELAAANGLIVVHGLAGRSRDTFNVRMELAAAKLKAGKFYEAAANYRLAVMLIPDNPLGWVGVALSRLGAGEPFTAAVAFRRAMQLLPPMMETRLAIGEMMDLAVVARQLEDLDGRLGEGEFVEPELAFLSTVLHQNLGQTDKARLSAAKLKFVAGDDKLLAAYAEYVLTGRRPGAKAPTTRPAG